MEKEILVKFGEIFLKGENREKFEKSLIYNINSRIKKFGNFSSNYWEYIKFQKTEFNISE